MLLELAEYAKQHDHLVASPTVTSDDMLERILEKLERAGEKQLNQKHPKVTGGTVGLLGFSAGIQLAAEQESKRSFAYRLLELCEQAGEAGKGILILVDEIRSNSEELKKLIIAYQEMVGECQNISMVFAGLPAAVSNVLNEHVLTFFNRAARLPLGPISLSEIDIYFRRCFLDSGIRICDEWIDLAAKQTNGSPYLMQLIGHYITISASNDGELTEAAFRKALKLANEEFIRDVCETTLSPLSDRDISFLKAMAEDAYESSLKDICTRLSITSAYAQRYKTRLIQAGIIEHSRRGFIQYAVPYLRDYFQKTVS